MAAQVTGRVHSVESFGTVDGPGVRFVVFLQGCPMRCLYCHNPDTWDPGGGVPTTVEELLAQYARNEAFYRKGGITVTGGEPLLQIEFVTALFREAKRRGIHTCVDTSGATFRPGGRGGAGAVRRAVRRYGPGAAGHQANRPGRPQAADRTGKWEHPCVCPLSGAKRGARMGTPCGCARPYRQRGRLERAGTLLASLPNVRALDVLPYHTMGRSKYDALGIPYPLEGTPAAEAPLAARARDVILAARRAALE